MDNIKFIRIILVFIFFILLFNCRNYSQQKPKILVISSYYKGTIWSDNEISGIESELKNCKFNGDLYIEYMDHPIINSNDEYYAELSSFLKKKFNRIRFDIIISLDDVAIQFLIKYHEETFLNIPVVFCGVSKSKENEIPKNKTFYGIFDDIDKKKNLDLALQLFPGTKNFIFINARTELFNRYEESFRDLKSNYAGIGFHFLKDRNADSLITKINALGKESIIFPISYIQDSNNVVAFEIMTSNISKKISSPIIGFWEDLINNGTIGGYLSMGESQGKTAARIALQVLQGTFNSNDLANYESTTQLAFDYNELKRFNIDLSSIPKEAKIYNYPVSYYEKHKELFLPVIIIIVILLSALFTLLLNISKRKKIEHELRISEQNLSKSNVILEETLSELKKMQEIVLQQERLRALGQMASGIAHDINNSLSPILGYADLLLKNDTIEQVAGKQINIIKTASADIKKTIERMREFYRPNLEETELTEIYIKQIIITSLELTRHKWKDFPEMNGKVIIITTDFELNLPIIYGSENEIREAIVNLIINAADAMPESGKLNIKAYSQRHFLFIEINDNGIGMDENTRLRCLEPFYTTKGEKGTGLGLAMVYGIMQRHQGKIEIDSAKDQGTRIKLIFPVSKNKTISNSSETEVTFNTPLNILCIDNDIQILELMESMIKKYDHHCQIANSGIIGIQKFKESIDNHAPFDLVISDLGMPNMDGKQVTRIIKEISPGTPVILLTGWGGFLQDDETDRFDLVLSKPVTTVELNQALKKAMTEAKK